MINRIVSLVLMVAVTVAVIASTGAQPLVTARAQQQTGSPLTGLGRFEKTKKWKGNFTLKGSGGGQDNNIHSRWTVNQLATGTFKLERVTDNLWEGNYEAVVTVDDSFTSTIDGKVVTSYYQGSGTVQGVMVLSIDNYNRCIYTLSNAETRSLTVTVTTGGNSSVRNYQWGPAGASLGIDKIAIPTSGKILSGGRIFRLGSEVGENDWDITWNAECDTEGNLNVGALRQNDPQWRSDLYDHSTDTIWAKGCALTSLAMAINFLGPIWSYTPRTLNQVMTQEGGYNGKYVSFPAATKKATFGAAKFHAVESNSTSGLDDILCMGFPVIIGVRLNATGTPHHYVIVTGKQGNEYLISDPAYNKTKLSEYGAFKIRGFVTPAEWNGPTKCTSGPDPTPTESNLDANTDTGQGTLTISANVEILVVDSNGKRTGYDPSAIEGRLNEIPESVYFRDALEDDLTGAPPDEVNHMVHIEHPAEGSYHITVIGQQAGPFSVTIDPVSQDGSPQTPTIVQGTVPVGSTSFQFQYSSDPGSTPTPAAVGFSSANYSVNESDLSGVATVAVNRSGDTSVAFTVDYTTSDSSGLIPCQNNVNGIASDRCDYATGVGTLRFAAGESTKSIQIPIINDAYVEPNENFTITLRKPQGGSLGSITTATVTIISDDTQTATTNPINGQEFFIKAQYIDFLGRVAEPGGFNFWNNRMNGVAGYCAPGETCDRVDTAKRFFESDEFKERGFYVYKLYDASLGRFPLYSEFVPEVARLNGPQTVQEQRLGKDAYLLDFMNKQEFKNLYDQYLTADHLHAKDAANAQSFVDALCNMAGVIPASKATLVFNLQNGIKDPAHTLEDFILTPEINGDGTRFYDRARIVMQYFGFLRRAPDTGGFNFWWNRVATPSSPQYHDYRELVNNFLRSDEYNFRFAFLSAP